MLFTSVDIHLALQSIRCGGILGSGGSTFVKFWTLHPPWGSINSISISCSFWENLAKSYVGAPPEELARALLGEILDHTTAGGDNGCYSVTSLTSLVSKCAGSWGCSFYSVTSGLHRQSVNVLGSWGCCLQCHITYIRQSINVVTNDWGC